MKVYTTAPIEESTNATPTFNSNIYLTFNPYKNVPKVQNINRTATSGMPSFQQMQLGAIFS